MVRYTDLNQFLREYNELYRNSIDMLRQLIAEITRSDSLPKYFKTLAISKVVYTIYENLESLIESYIIYIEENTIKSVSYHKELLLMAKTLKYKDDYILGRSTVATLNKFRMFRNTFVRGYPSDLERYNMAKLLDDAIFILLPTLQKLCYILDEVKQEYYSS